MIRQPITLQEVAAVMKAGAWMLPVDHPVREEVEKNLKRHAKQDNQ